MYKMTSLAKLAGRSLGFVRAHLRLLIICVVGLGLVAATVVVGSYQAIAPYGKYVLSPQTAQQTKVGMVLGAGVTPDGLPYEELQARLDSAADAYDADIVDKLIVSGDNRYVTYNEPGVMMRYLRDVRHIPAAAIQPDYAGRSTYESCERAAKIFNLEQVIIFSAGSHLPRAIYLCRHFGIEAYGIANQVEATNANRREVLARVKAVWNVHVLGEPTVQGSSITL